MSGVNSKKNENSKEKKNQQTSAASKKHSKKLEPYKKKKTIFSNRNLKKAAAVASVLGLGGLIVKHVVDKNKKSEQDKRLVADADKLLKETNKTMEESTKRFEREKEEIRKRMAFTEQELNLKRQIIFNSRIILQNLLKTKKESEAVKSLLYELDLGAMDAKELGKEVCKLKKIIFEKDLEECSQPFVSNKRNCMLRTMTKYGVSYDQIKYLSEILGC